MNKSQLIDTLAARFEGNRKQAAHALESVLDTITREVMVARPDIVSIEARSSVDDALEIALIENLQRKDLTPFEEAEGYRLLKIDTLDNRSISDKVVQQRVAEPA